VIIFSYLLGLWHAMGTARELGSAQCMEGDVRGLGDRHIKLYNRVTRVFVELCYTSISAVPCDDTCSAVLNSLQL